MIVIVTPRPTRPGHRGRTSVELYVAALAAQLSQRHPLTLVSPKRGPVEGAAARRLLKRCLALDPAIVQVENRPRWVLALRRFGYRGRIILHLHSQTFLDPRRLGPAAARRAVRAADVIVCNSDDLRRRL
ncbi:MAG TPA: glycosyltransferase, partial [Bacillota bacterium]